MATLAIAILAAAATATPAAGAFRQVAETRNFVFYTRDNAKVDAGASQRFLEETSRKLGVRLEGKRAYYRYSWPEELAFVLGRAASGANGAYTATGDVHSIKAFDAHEIVHRVAFEIGDPGSLLQEGLAVELGDGGRYERTNVDAVTGRLVRQVEFRTLADRFSSLAPEVRYPLAGSFVHFLIKRHGIAKVAELFRACRNAQARDTEFAKIMGQSLDDAGRDWTAALAR
jgi:hypothetical protein